MSLSHLFSFRLFIFIVFSLCIIISPVTFATFADEELNLAQTPDWIISRNIDPLAYLKDENPDGGAQILLGDIQVRFEKTGPEAYSHFIARLHSLNSIEKYGTQTIAWAPAYQSYQIHQLIVWRDGKSIDMLPSVKATFNYHDVAPGTPAHEGQATIQLYLPDLQRGDVVDFSYSVHGQNAAFGDHILASNVIIATQRTHNIYRRFLVPLSKEIQIIRNGGHKNAEVKEAGDYRSYEWYWDTLDQVIYENGTPNWFPQIPTMMINDFLSWSDVASWAEPLFTMPTNRTEEIQSLASDLIVDSDLKLARLQAIYNFMQSEIRYVGMEIGRNGYKPFDPDTVLARRYGDCKDQTMLMIALLAEAGIKAIPALVNNQGGKITDLFGVSPLAFNHVIVRAEIDDKIYWLDPTKHLSKERQANLTPPRFEKTLLLHAGSTELTDIPLQEPEPESPHLFVSDHYKFEDGVFGKLQWSRSTLTSGDYADGFRQIIENIGIRQLGISLREQHKRNHDGLENSELTNFTNDDNSLSVEEEYLIPNAGIYDSQRRITEFEYRPKNIAQVLHRPRQVKKRKTPYAVSFPLRRRTEVHFTVDDVSFEEFKSELESPYHRYKNIGKMIGDTFVMTIDYETLQDHVPSEDIEDHAQEIDRIWNEIFIRVWANGEESSSYENTYAYQPAAKKSRVRLLPPSGDDQVAYGRIMLSLKDRLDTANPLDDLYTSDLLSIFSHKFKIDQAQKNKLLIIAASRMIAVGDKEEALKFLTLFNLMELDEFDEILEFRAQIYGELGLLEKEREDLENLISNSGYINPLKNSIWNKRLRTNLWQIGRYKELSKILKRQIKTIPSEQLYRELLVTYNRMGEKRDAKQIRQKMKTFGFNELPISKNSESKGQPEKEKAYLLLSAQPRYPLEATEKNIEGFAVAEFDIQANGTVTNCKIIDSEPEKIFDDSACNAVNRFIYYPLKKGQTNKQYRTRLRYNMPKQ